MIGAVWGIPPASVGIYAAFLQVFDGLPKLTDVMSFSTWFMVGAMWLVIAFIVTILVSAEGSYHYARSLHTTIERKVKEDLLNEKLLTTLKGIAQTSKGLPYTADSMYVSLEGRSTEIIELACRSTSCDLAPTSEQLIHVSART